MIIGFSLYSLISVDSSKLSNLISDEKENYISNTANDNTDSEQAKNENLYLDCNDY